MQEFGNNGNNGNNDNSNHDTNGNITRWKRQNYAFWDFLVSREWLFSNLTSLFFFFSLFCV